MEDIWKYLLKSAFFQLIHGAYYLAGVQPCLHHDGYRSPRIHPPEHRRRKFLWIGHGSKISTLWHWSQKCGISLEYHWNPKTQSSQFSRSVPRASAVNCAQTPRHYNSWTASGYANIQSALDLGHLGLLAMRNPMESIHFMDDFHGCWISNFHILLMFFIDFHPYILIFRYFHGFPISFIRATRPLLEVLDPLGRCHRGRFRTAPHFWWSNPLILDPQFWWISPWKPSSHQENGGLKARICPTHVPFLSINHV